MRWQTAVLAGRLVAIHDSPMHRIDGDLGVGTVGSSGTEKERTSKTEDVFPFSAPVKVAEKLSRNAGKFHVQPYKKVA